MWFRKQIWRFYSLLIFLRVMWLPNPNRDPELLYQSPWDPCGSDLYTSKENPVHSLERSGEGYCYSQDFWWPLSGTWNCKDFPSQQAADFTENLNWIISGKVSKKSQWERLRCHQRFLLPTGFSCPPTPTPAIHGMVLSPHTGNKRL